MKQDPAKGTNETLVKEHESYIKKEGIFLENGSFSQKFYAHEVEIRLTTWLKLCHYVRYRNGREYWALRIKPF